MMEAIVWTPPIVKRGRPPLFDKRMSAAEQSRNYRKLTKSLRITRIGVIDFETDPFDAENNGDVKPFTGCIYTDDFDPIVIWNEDFNAFIEELIAELEALEHSYIFYAHNGGKFDYMFLMHKIRGDVKFKGRGIMSARLGKHELRDSFHIIPEKLANLQKDDFDYKYMRAEWRNKKRDEIIRYMISDCRYLLDYVKAFVEEHGLKISIGQAAMYELKQHYTVKKLAAPSDAFVRRYFFGGRVECLQGRGYWKGDYKLYDVNSMYPHVMANFQHPIGNNYVVRSGDPGPHTVFLAVECRNFGAFVMRGENNETSATEEYGTFLTTIWEYEAAVRLGLIDVIQIKHCVDVEERSDFKKFILPLYEKREITKQQLRILEKAGKENTAEYQDIKKQNIFLKLKMNNAYGKFAQNPRKFKESYITEPDEMPDDGEWGDLPAFRSDLYSIWERPAPCMAFNNVGTAASITGAARAVLMEAIHNAVDPIYCDTDSLICKKLANTELHESKLGAWDLEAEFQEVIIAGKKLYGCRAIDPKTGHWGQPKIKSKGASGLSWEQIVSMLDEKIIEVLNKAPTLTKRGEQFYMRRRIRATAPLLQQRRNYSRRERIAI